MLADRVALMFDGVLQQVGAPNAFFRSPRTTSVARFFRNGNFLKGVRKGSTVHTIVGDLAMAPSASPDRNGPVVVTVRPEEVQLADGDTARDNVVSAVVTSLIYMGSHTQLAVTISDAIWQIHGPATLEVNEGDEIMVRLPPEHLAIVEDDDDHAALGAVTA